MAKSTDQILNPAAERRQEDRVVDVGLAQTLVVVSELKGGGEFYGLPAVTVPEITYLLGTPSWIPGVVNVWGEIESVLGLGRL
jgi:hypothetical protein